jgi:hypothetical protein
MTYRHTHAPKLEHDDDDDDDDDDDEEEEEEEEVVVVITMMICLMMTERMRGWRSSQNRPTLPGSTVTDDDIPTHTRPGTGLERQVEEGEEESVMVMII